jgi:hydrogenase maturation protein HypF
MLAGGVNAPFTTSAGRLFDGVAALAGLHPRARFEGQAAMALEHAACQVAADDPYPLPVAAERDGPARLDWRPLVTAVLDDLRRGAGPGVVGARFHAALVEAIVAIARRTGVARVALSGGCFQNRLLLEGASERLEAAGFTVLLHRQVPPNDGGIALGQVLVAAASLGRLSAGGLASMIGGREGGDHVPGRSR